MRFRLHKSKVVQVFMISMFIGMSFASGTNFDESDLSNNDYVLALFYESTSGETLDHGIISSWYMDPVRWQEVYIRQEIFDISRQNKGDLIQLNVFDDRILTGTISDVVEYIKGTKTVYGSINEAFYGTFVIAITDDTCLITIRIPSERELFITQFDSTSNVHYTVELDINLYRDEPYAGPLIPPVEDELSDDGIHDTFNEKAPTSLDALNSQTNTNIDVMIVYTPEAKTWANQAGGGINNVVSTAMANSQIVLDNSQTYVTMRLVYSGVVNYEESGDNGLDLNRFTFGFGNMSEVHEWRDQYGADLVKLLTRSGNYGGVAWLPRSAQGSPDLGFSLTRVHLAAMTYTPIHEMGHNMGCHHHKQQNFQPGPGIFSYAAGWRWTGNDSLPFPYYCTVMTYTSGVYFADGRTHTQVPYFSNPNVQYEGFPTGHSFHGDNARTIREIRHVISSY
ncbi:MAG: zinc-dependent metalloprotease family protein, partial [Candidatus Thermoplasmatota archaeon]|nr:zinc-dependent metalloprotease family protein [Candidatus Thermoplasmatota archaeon]